MIDDEHHHDSNDQQIGLTRGAFIVNKTTLNRASLGERCQRTHIFQSTLIFGII